MAGRPRGSKNKSAQFRHYNPKRWDPRFDLIVIESVAGKSNDEIAMLFGYTKEHVSNILSTAEAQKIKERIRSTINKEFDSGLKDRIAAIGAKTIERIESFIQDDHLYEASPFNFIDRAIKIGQSVSAIGNDSRNGNTTIVNGNAIVMNGDQANNIRDALLKSQELEEVEVGKIPEKLRLEA